MARASARLDGVTAPIDSGFSIQERMKRTSSSRRNTVLFLETAECVLDLLFDSAALQLEQPNLFLEFLFEELECWQRHRG